MLKTVTQTKTAGWMRDLASHVSDLESFLKAALLHRTYPTADFDSPTWTCPVPSASEFAIT